MEWFTILLSSFITIISPVGLIVDRVVADALRSQVAGVEQLAVRVDNTPSYQPISGKIDRILIASRGIEIIENLRIDSFELETDAIDIDINKLQTLGGIKEIPSSLNKPFQGAFSLVINENDLNEALESNKIRSQLQKLVDSLLPPQAPQFEILKLRLNFIAENRLGLAVELEQEAAEGEKPNKLAITAEVGFEVEKGRKISLIDLNATLNERKLSQRFLTLLTTGISERLDLGTFEDKGLIARILELNINDNTVIIAAFFRINTSDKD